MKAFQPYFSEWLVRQYFAGRWLILVVMVALISLATCGFEAPQDRRAHEELPQTIKGIEKQLWDLETRVIALEAVTGIKREAKP